MEQETHRRKIEETVIEIVKNADMETATECTIRNMAAEKLGVDLSDVDSKRLVRRTVESFLLTSALPEMVEKVQEETKELVETCARVICKLSEKRSVSIRNFRGRPLVAIREYYQKDGKQIPSSRGISLTSNQWSAFSSSVPDIEATIVKMESRIRAEGIGKQTESEISTSQHVTIEKSQTREDVSNSVATFSPQPLVPISTTRFNGKNYYCWMHQMEFFLKQLKIAYVLSDPCPSISFPPKETYKEIGPAKISSQKWINDDYICRHNILNSLSDQLFDQYSVKTYSAQELWEELRSAYADDFGTKRSQVNNYIQFQMVDGIPVLEQVQELHKIADIIVASGIWFDENFHVSAIISKLPPSWKECRAKLMREEFLPLDKLMYHLKDEEELRNRHKKEEHCKNVHVVEPNPPKDKLGQSMREMKRLCYNCQMEGHMARNCPRYKWKADHRERSNRKENDVVPVSLEVNTVERVVEHPKDNATRPEKSPETAL